MAYSSRAVRWLSYVGDEAVRQLGQAPLQQAWDQLATRCPWATVAHQRAAAEFTIKQGTPKLVVGRGRSDAVEGLALMALNGSVASAGVAVLGNWAWLALPVVGDWFWEGALSRLQADGVTEVRVRQLDPQSPMAWRNKARSFGRSSIAQASGHHWVWEVNIRRADQKLEKRLLKRHVGELKARGAIRMVRLELSELPAHWALPGPASDLMRAYALMLGDTCASRCLVAGTGGSRHITKWEDTEGFEGLAPGLAQACLLEKEWAAEGVQRVTAAGGPRWLRHSFEEQPTEDVSIHLSGWAPVWDRFGGRVRRAGRRALDLWDPISR